MTILRIDDDSRRVAVRTLARLVPLLAPGDGPAEIASRLARSPDGFSVIPDSCELGAGALCPGQSLMLRVLMTSLRDMPTDLSAEPGEALDSELKSLLHDIENEEAPERLLELARELQKLLSLARQRREN